MAYTRWYDNKSLLTLWYIEQGLTMEQMAEKAGVTQETIRLLLLKHNIKESRK